MLNVSKEELINKLSLIEDVIFVGGTSEYIQGIKSELNDIDISISNIDLLKSFGYVFQDVNDTFYGLSGQRAFVKTVQTHIDAFVDDKRPDYITVNGKKCETIDSMINLRKKTIESGKTTNPIHVEKLKTNLERLQQWKAQTE